MKRYFNVYLQLLAFTIKQMLEYRANFIARSLFVPVWQLVFLGVILTMFNHTDQIGGWNFDEMMVLYFVTQLFFGLTYFTFFEGGFRYMMSKGVRLGEFDFILTRPLNPVFLAMFSRPDISPLLSMGVTFPIFGWYVFHVGLVPTPLNLLLSVIATFFSFLIVFFVCASYTTLAFKSVQARQVVELVNKASEFAQYPMDVFTQPVKLVFFTILPTFFFGYVIAAFFVNKGNLNLMLIMLVVTTVSYFINQLAWKSGLKHYSSASS